MIIPFFVLRWHVEGAGKDLELSGAGKELAGVGNWGALFLGLRGISETVDPKILKFNTKSRKRNSKRVQN